MDAYYRLNISIYVIVNYFLERLVLMYKKIDAKLKLLSKLSLIIGIITCLIVGYSSIKQVICALSISEVPGAVIRNLLLPEVAVLIIQIFCVVTVSYLLYAFGYIIELLDKEKS